MDLATVRAEIKTWERDFRATHGRDPSIQEIKAKPSIAGKYKLYKTLSRAASSGSVTTSAASTRPSTPPRQPPASSLLQKARAVKVDPPHSSSNPFSPVKNRNKYSDPAPSLQRASNQSRQNPFATPSKPKHKPHFTRRSPSPDPFPLIQPLLLLQRPPLSPVADSAVTRARKRLRGEPVSPSPVKEKRPRVTSQAALSFAGRPRPHSPDDSDGDEITADPNDTIMADTPMKPHTRGRNYKVLFNDAPSNVDKNLVRTASSRKKALSPARSLLGLKRERSRALTPSSDEEDDWSTKPKLRSLEASAKMPEKVKRMTSTTRAVNGRRGIPQALVPTKDDLWSEVGPTKAIQSNSAQSQSQSASTSRRQNKRAFPDDLEKPLESTGSTASSYLNLPLLPPSPPPPNPSGASSSKYANKGKANAAAFGRKKAKVLRGTDATDDSESLEDDEIQVKEIDPASRLPNGERDGGPDSDWEGDWRARPNSDDAPTRSNTGPTGKFEVSLPDDLQRILAISPHQEGDRSEEKVVRGLLYGSRETHYNPSKGGEIWDVGEESGDEGGTEDWEGEPVPWEVGEL